MLAPVLASLAALSLCVAGALTAQQSPSPDRAADLILHGGLLWTGDADRPRATALAIRGERITAVGDDATVQALQALGVALRESVPANDSLPRVVTFTPPGVAPSLLIAYRLDGDLARELDLVARNGIPHPGFVPAQPLEVLRDA